MRLFISINFDDNIKKYIQEIQTHLKRISKRGNFTHDENLHLTLVFLGEIEANKIEQVQQAMDAISVPKFELSIGNIGRFKRDRGDIIWVNVEKNKTLLAIYDNLCRQLNAKGFEVQDREYKPHITLTRNTLLTGDLGLVLAPTIKTTINRISLMKSERIEGRLTYTEIYAKELG